MVSEQSGKEEYDFWAALVGLLKPKRILEIGTSAGYGTLALARNADEETEIITVDVTDARCKAVKKTFAKKGIRFIQENSLTVFSRFQKINERFDLIVIDGDHHYQTVCKEWEHARELSKTLIFHDALQFNGVRRVVNRIRCDADWDVSVLSYPGTTLIDDLSGEAFFSNRCPGIAIATRKTSLRAQSFNGFLEHPTLNSRRALNRRRIKFRDWHAADDRSQDLSFADWEMIFHILWNFQPDAIIHLGHVGTGATLLFLEFARSKKAKFLGIDPTGKFWLQKKITIPLQISNADTSMVLTGRIHTKEALSFIRNHRKTFLWVDEFYDHTPYGRPLQQMLKQLSRDSLACIRNFSPFNGNPQRISIGESECTNPRAYRFSNWLGNQTYAIRSASPEATFGDYVNAGHWLIIQSG